MKYPLLQTGGALALQKSPSAQETAAPLQAPSSASQGAFQTSLQSFGEQGVAIQWCEILGQQQVMDPG